MKKTAGFMKKVFLSVIFSLSAFGVLLHFSASAKKLTSPFRVVWISDTHLGFYKSNQAFKEFLKEVKAFPFKPNLFINTGDVAELGTTHYFKVYKNGMESFKAPFLTTIGNHDTRWNPLGKKDFQKIIGPLYYSKNIDGIHWIFLDSTLERQPFGHISVKEMEWLKQDLKKVPPDMPIFTFSHHPFFWHGVDVDNGLNLIGLYKGHDAAAFFNGHGHKLEILSFRNIPFIENDALFNGHFVVIQKTGDEIQLYVKTLGKPGLKPWFRFPLHPKPPTARIVYPSLDKRVPAEFSIKIKRVGRTPVKLLLDHCCSIPLHTEHLMIRTGSAAQGIQSSVSQIMAATAQEEYLHGTVSLKTPGWHSLDLYLSGHPLPIDEIRVFYPGKRSQWMIHAYPIGEIYGNLARGKGLIFGGTLDGRLEAVNSKGKIAWEKHLDGTINTSVTYSHGLVFADTDNGFLYAFNGINGHLVWKVHSQFPWTGAPMADGKRVFAASGRKTLCAFSFKSGKRLWVAKLGKFAEMEPVESHGRVFIGAWDNYFYCLSAETGKLIWRKRIGKYIYFSPATAEPIVLKNSVYVIGKNGVLYSFDVKTGKLLWKTKAAEGISSPILWKNLILAPLVNGTLEAFDLHSGKPVWTQRFPALFFNASPVLYHSVLFLISPYGYLFRFNLADRKIISKIRVSYGFDFSTPVILNHELWIGSLDGNLYAVHLSKTGK